MEIVYSPTLQHCSEILLLNVNLIFTDLFAKRWYSLFKRLKLLANYYMYAKSRTQHRTGTLQQLTEYLDMQLIFSWMDVTMTACHSGSVTASDWISCFCQHAVSRHQALQLSVFSARAA